jgi:7-carboxy-7-deazaguanine synthase
MEKTPINDHPTPITGWRQKIINIHFCQKLSCRFAETLYSISVDTSRYQPTPIDWHRLVSTGIDVLPSVPFLSGIMVKSPTVEVPVLNVCEIFKSIQGESTHVGRPCVFVRLAGCNLRCSYCDTAYAYAGGTEMPETAVLARLAELGSGIVEVTGGEPLLQEAGLLGLCTSLQRVGRIVLVETNGSLPLPPRPRPFHAILDVKCPGSGESGRVCWDNLHFLQNGDEVKFVVSDQADFDWGVEIVRRFGLEARVAVLFSPVFGKVEPQALASWVVASGLDVRMQLQLHKCIWPLDARGV